MRTTQQALNDAIRTGFTRRGSRTKRRVVQTTYSLGSEEQFRWDKSLATADAIEDDALARRVQENGLSRR